MLASVAQAWRIEEAANARLELGKGLVGMSPAIMRAMSHSDVGGCTAGTWGKFAWRIR